MAENTLEFDKPLQRLERNSECAAQVFECHDFAALGEQETADTFGLSLRTAHCEWNLPRGWLAQRPVS